MKIQQRSLSRKPRVPATLLIAGGTLAFVVAAGGAASELSLRGEASETPAPEHMSARRAVAAADSISRFRQDSINRSLPGYVVDSILPAEEGIRRFRADLASAPTALRNAVASRARLVAAFVQALERSDAAALGSLALDRAEFAYLVYPESPYVHPPYSQPPALVWMTMQSPSLTGARRLLQRFGGKRLGVKDVDCPLRPERQGANRLWTGCTVLVSIGDSPPVRRRLFGTIIERNGRFKFVSYRNDL